MNSLLNTKLVAITPPGAIVDNASLTTAEIDTLGFDYMQVIVHLGATDIAMTALTVTESDTAGSGHANVTGLIWGTSANIAGSTSTLPSSTDDNKFFVADIDLRGRKRYIDVTATCGDGAAGTYITIIGLLSRKEVGITTAAERGCQEILRV